MSGLLNKVMNFVGYETEEEIEEEQEIMPVLKTKKEEKEVIKKNKVVNINATTQLKVVVLSPESLEDAREVVSNLKAKKPVVINIEGVDREVKRRIIDFLSGAVDALDADMQKVSAGIFLLAPYNVSIMGDFKNELCRGAFPLNF